MLKVLLLTPLLAAVFCPNQCLASSATAPRKTLTAYAGERELSNFLKTMAEEVKRRRERDNARQAAKPSSAPAPAPAGSVQNAAKALANEESVTNVQHAGVDEGGIVKVHGDHLVILRRGRLFTVLIAEQELKPAAFVDAFAPDVDPSGTWYDEMLISGNTIIVIGYSYARGGTEISLFDISRSGQLTHKGTYHLRSNDYYSSRNYASRLIGSKLIFYTPLYLNLWNGDPYASFPAFRKWRTGATPAEFKRIAPATRIYRTDEPLDPFAGIALHTVTICDLAQVELSCESTAVLGASGRVFYVSPKSVFVWTTSWLRDGKSNTPNSSVFRIPLDGSAPSALKVAGSPVDQFSFLESEDGRLNVLVRSNGRGDGMWAAEVNSGDLALLRVSLSSFSDGKDSAPAHAYRALPKPNGYALHNRYVGSYLLYGAGTGWGRAQTVTESEIYAVRYTDSVTYAVPLAHAVDRIEALGSHAVAIGSDGKDLHFTSLRLARFPAAAGRYTRKNAAQGETRSHGFYYKADDAKGGMLGLPIIGGGEQAGGQLRRESAALLFLRNQELAFSELGSLDSRPGANEYNDACRASCVDWYGNSRPLFLRGRVFALMGYEIVEGTIKDKRIVETQRMSFAPRMAEISR